ncbi:MAG: anhydro-N-acetylmuramic acid kinase [Planctomycetes bacterium]|nr:anhydro-N-acetylmuramic acid kinase [Planctomycetota bacterium]
MNRDGVLAVGLMSGTSADGVSAALVRIGPGRTLRVLAHRTDPLPRRERERLLSLGTATAAELSEANFRIGRRFASAARRLLRSARILPRRVLVIGSHGQTVYHDSGRHTLQIGEPAVIAEETGIDVVADFRPRDIAAGGQGAPLVPFFDEFVFGHAPRPRALLNLGGIANLTVVGGRVLPLAFDTGPGNCLIDEAVRLVTGGRRGFDRNGERASRGRVDRDLLLRLFDHPYFSRRPPKSTGRELFGRSYVEGRCGSVLRRRPNDAIATLTYFTARAIAEAIARFVPVPLEEVIVSGGGALNSVLTRHLEWMLFPAAVRPSIVYGVDPMAKEPAAFALLAVEAIRGRTNTLPSATGARRAVIAGKIVRAGGRP